MKRLRQIHLYLGCLFAPVLIFFAVTGAWQLFGLHRGTKDGYRPPQVVSLLSEIHKFQHFPVTSTNPDTSSNPRPRPFQTSYNIEDTPLRYFILAASVGLVVSTILGIIMAFRFGRSRISAILCLLAGVVVPVIILSVYQ